MTTSDLTERLRIEQEARTRGWIVRHPAPHVMYMASGEWTASVRWSADGVITAAMATEPGGLTWARNQSTNGPGVGSWMSSVLKGQVCVDCGANREAGEDHDCI